MAIRFIGILISRRTDIIALAAFIIAIGGIITQIFYFLQGPKTSFVAPEQIVIVRKHYKNDTEYMRVIARMAYVNEGRPGYNDIVKKEMVSFQIGEKSYTLYWQNFVTSGNDEEDNIIIEKTGDAVPVAIFAGNVNSHETYFSPRHALTGEKYRNYLEWEEFKRNIDKVEELIFIFSYELFSGEIREVKCKINIDEGFMIDIDSKSNNKTQWTVTSCIEINKASSVESVDEWCLW